MSISKYKKPLILVGIYYVFGTILFFSFPPEASRYTLLLPIGNGGTQMFLMFIIFFPLSAIIGSFVIGYILVPIFLFLHVKLFGRNLEYGIIEKETPIKFKKTFQAFFPILLIMNLTLILASNQYVISKILYPEHHGALIGSINAIAILPILMFTIGIGMGIFSAIWFLNDAGLIYSNKKKVKGTGRTHEIRSLGGFFRILLRGYAGISVILSYFQFIFAYAGGMDQLYYVIGQSLVYIAIPFLLTCSSALAIIILDIVKQKNINYVRKLSRKLGIIDTIEISFEIKNRIMD